MLTLGRWRQLEAHSIDVDSDVTAVPGSENLTAETVESLESTPISTPSDIMWFDDNILDEELDIATNPPSSHSPQQSPTMPESNASPCVAHEQSTSSTSSPTEGTSGDLDSTSYVTTSRSSSPPSTFLPSVDRLRELMESWEAGVKAPENQPLQEDSSVMLAEIETAWDSAEQLESPLVVATPPPSPPPISQPQPTQLSNSLLCLLFPNHNSPPAISQLQSYTETPSRPTSQGDSDPAVVACFPPTHALRQSDDMDHILSQVVNDDTPVASHERLAGHSHSFSTSIAETPTLDNRRQSTTSYANYIYSLPSSRGSSAPPLLADSYPYVAIPQSPRLNSAFGDLNSAQPILAPSPPVTATEGAPQETGCRTRSSTFDSESSYNLQGFFRCPPVTPVYPASSPSGFPLTHEEDSDSTLTRTESPVQSVYFRSPSLQESRRSSITANIISDDNSNSSDDESFGNPSRRSNAGSPWNPYVRRERIDRVVDLAGRDRTVTPYTLPYGINTRPRIASRDSRPLPRPPVPSQNLTSPWCYGPPINDSNSAHQDTNVPSNWNCSPAMPICVLPPSAPPTTSPTLPATNYISSPPLPSPPLSFDHAFASLSLQEPSGAAQTTATSVRIPINDNSSPSGMHPSPPGYSWGMPVYNQSTSAPSSRVTPRLSSCYTGSTLPRDARLTAPPPPRSHTGMSPSYQWGTSSNYGGNVQNDPVHDVHANTGGYAKPPWAYPPPPPTATWSEPRPASYRKLRFAPLPETPVYKNGGYAPAFAANNNNSGYTPQRNSVSHLSPLAPFVPPLASPSRHTEVNTLNVPPRFPSPQIPHIIPTSFVGPSAYHYGVSNNNTYTMFPPIPPIVTRPMDFSSSNAWPYASPAIQAPFVPPPLPRSRFYFEDGNITFEVGGKNFMVHRHFLQQHSQRLRSQYGSTLPSWISFDSEITLREMENLMTIFYPENLVTSELSTTDEWEQVLSISVTLQMPQIKALALRNLTLVASAYERIDLFRRACEKNWTCTNDPEILQWKKDALKELCLAQEPPSLEDAKKLDLETLVGVWQARHELSSAGLSGELSTPNSGASKNIGAANSSQLFGGPRSRKNDAQVTPPHLPPWKWAEPPLLNAQNKNTSTPASRRANFNELLVDRVVEDKFGLNNPPKW